METESQAHKTCMECGMNGLIHNNHGWLKVLCQNHIDILSDATNESSDTQ
jgi:hypothetical protein